ncbi:UNVERIFIED_CONTAM: cytochrome [Sesamum radiatum]|uniref:Cytochrome n=1 Tax=Sesamum radiatum TaxID=300843 RepID=A0AAW2PKP6_SESRA
MSISSSSHVVLHAIPIQRAPEMVAYQTLIVPLVSFLLFIIFLHKPRSTAASPPRKRLPPSPRKLPIIGNLHQLGVYPHRSFQALSRRYGQLMLLHLGQVPVLVASSADAACEIMRNQDLIFSNRPRLSIPDRLTYGSRDVAFAPYGEYWRQARSICVLQLLSNKMVQSFRRVREEETSNMIDKIRQLGSSSSVVDLSDVLVTTTNDVFCRVALGRKYGDEDGDERKINKVLGEFVELLGTSSSVGDYIPWLGWRSRVNGLDAKVEKVAKLLDEFLEGVIQEHRDHRDKGEKVCDDGFCGDGGLDFVDILLEFQTESKGSSPPVEVDTIKAIILVRTWLML